MSRDNVRINVVSEMLDERNRKLAEVCQIDDFIVSDHLVSLMMTQVSENPRDQRGLRRPVRQRRRRDLPAARRLVRHPGQGR